MALFEQISEDIKTAMKARDTALSFKKPWLFF